MLLNDRYLYLEQVGQGGFGSIYKATDTSFGDRLVAIKEMEQKNLNPQELAQAVASFKQEALLLANLRHPHLPRIYDYFSDSGCWYLVMDYIEGQTLEAYLQMSPRDLRSGKQHLAVKEVLAIGLELCSVLEYLHTCTPPIIFRDLKPANVMRTSEGHLYLIDFGIARHFKPDQIKDTIPLGSPGYAAPEQYGKMQTTPQVDIYSLGVILHELLTGDDPTLTPFLLTPMHTGDDPILARVALLIEHMTAIDANHRPTSAAAVAQELQQIEASQSGQRSLPQAEKGGVHFFSADQEEAPAAQQQPIFAERSGEGKQSSSGGVSRRMLLVSATTLGTALAGLGILIVSANQSPSTAPTTRSKFAPAQQVSTKSKFVPAQQPVRSKLSPPGIYAYTGHTSSVLALTRSPNGAHIASASADKSVQIFDAATGAPILIYIGHSAVVAGVGWSPDGTYIASTDFDSSVQMWEAATGKLVHTLASQPPFSLSGPIYGGFWSTEVARVAVLVDGYLNLIDVNTWENLGSSIGPVTMAVNAASWAPHDPTIAVAQEDHSVFAWGVNTDVTGTRGVGHTRKVLAVDWSPDGTKLVSGGQDNTVRTWSIPPQGKVNIQDATNLLIYQGHSDWVQAVAWSPDGKKIASAGRDTTVHIWNATTGNLLFLYKGHKAPVNALLWSHDSTIITSASDDQTVQVWKAG